MAIRMTAAQRVVSGTFGEVWLDGEAIAECYGCQAKVQINSEAITLTGQFMEDYKSMNGKGTGSLSLYKVDSGMIQRMQGILKGRIPVFTVVSKLADPDAAGAERVALYGVQFTDLTLLDWQRAAVGKVTAPFTFRSFELLDAIPVE